MREGIERVLWTLDVLDLNDNLKTQEAAIKTSVNKMCNNFPFDQPTYSQSIYTLGIAFENEQSVSSGNLFKVLKGSDAYDKGLRDGDAIIGAYAGYDCSFFLTRTRHYYFKPNKRDRKKNGELTCSLFYPLFPNSPITMRPHTSLRTNGEEVILQKIIAVR